MTSSKILTEQHLQQIKNAQDIITTLKNEIDLAKRAGVDVTAMEVMMNEAQAKLQQFRNVYFPGQ